MKGRNTFIIFGSLLALLMQFNQCSTMDRTPSSLSEGLEPAKRPVRLIVKKSAYDKIKETYGEPQTIFAREFAQTNNRFEIDRDWNCSLNPVTASRSDGGFEIIRRDLNCSHTVKDEQGYVANSHWIFESFSCEGSERYPASGQENIKFIEYEYDNHKVDFEFKCL